MMREASIHNPGIKIADAGGSERSSQGEAVIRSFRQDEMHRLVADCGVRTIKDHEQVSIPVVRDRDLSVTYKVR